MRGDPLVKCSGCSDFAHLSRTGTLLVPRLCATCIFWRDRQEAMTHPIASSDVRADGVLYVLDDQGDEGGGPAVDIRWLQGGHLRTTRLRIVGMIPDHLRGVLGDNAVVSIAT